MITVVTGATGFIGSVLVKELLRRGHKVRAVTYGDTSVLDGLDVEVVDADIRRPETLVPAFADADTVYHLAVVISLVGNQGGVVSNTNIDGARNAAQAALDAGVRRYVHFSSVHAFDLNTSNVVDEHTPRVGKGHPIYDRTKWAGEQAVRELIGRGLNGVIVHPSGVLGPGDHQPSRIGEVLIRFERRALPALITGGFNWVDVRDVVSGAIAAAEKGRTGESYLLSGHWKSTRELAEISAEFTNQAPPAVTLPVWLLKPLATATDLWGLVTKSEPLLNSDALFALGASRKISCEKAKLELGYEPRPLRETIRDAYRWFHAHNMLQNPLPDEVNDGN